jgi:hypothetical protein
VEDLALSYQFVLILSEDFRAGKTLRASIHSFLATHHGEFAQDLLNWLRHCEKGTLNLFFEEFRKKNSSIYQQSLFELLQLHLRGASILEPLESLELEMRQASRAQLDAHLGQLPFKLLLPLLLFQFPSLLILIVGPLLHHLLQEVQ